MADIQHDFPIFAPPGRVYEGVTTPAGLDVWWSKKSRGTPEIGAEYELWFSPEHDWRAKVTRAVRDREFVLQMTRSDPDWNGTLVSFVLEPRQGGTHIRFRHSGWPHDNDHFRTSSYCWAMYLRILKRNLEYGEVVAYERRLDV